MATEKLQADETRWTLGLETEATGSPISDKSDLEQRSYVATSFTIDEDAEKAQSDALRAGYSDTFGELAGLWGSGGITFEAPEGEGLLPVMKAIMGDASPVSTAVPNKTILPASTPLTKHVVAGANLFGAGNKTILDNMSQYEQLVFLEISTTGATLIDTAVDGTVVMTYDVNGTETDLTTTFTDANKATPQDKSLPANAKVVKVTTTGFSAGTFDIEAKVEVLAQHDLTTASPTLSSSLDTYPQAVVLKVVPSSATTLTAANTPGTITITYTVTGVSGNQTKTLSFADAVKTVSQNVFLPANSTLSSIAIAGFSAGTVDIDGVFPLLDADFFANTDTVDVIVVAGADIDSSSITVADDLGGYNKAHTLTVSPSEDADLTSSGTPATIVIAYNQDGEAKSGTLSFADSVKTTAQTFDLPANSKVTSVATTGWTSAGKLDITAPIASNLVYSPDFDNPGQLRFQCTTANPDGEIKIKGLRKVGISTKDWLLLDEDHEFGATGTTDVTLDKYFRTLNSIEILNSDGDALIDGTITLTSVPGGYDTVVRMADRILPKYTIEAEVGGIPRLIEGAQFIGATISNEGTLSIEADVLARRVDKRRTVDSGYNEKFTSTMEDNESEFPFVSVGFFSGIGGYLELDGEVVLFDSAPITINSNYGDSGEKAGSLFRPPPERQGRRQVTCAVNCKARSGTSADDKFIRWDKKFRDNAAVKAKLVQYRWADDGRQKKITWDMGYCEITSPVREEASSPGSIPITISLKAVPDPNTNETAEITLTITNDDQQT